MRVLNPNVNNTDRGRLVSFSSWLHKIGSDGIEKVLWGIHDDVDISNSMCLNNNTAILNFVYNNLEIKFSFWMVIIKNNFDDQNTEVDNINNTKWNWYIET